MPSSTSPSERSRQIKEERFQTIYGFAQSIRTDLDVIEKHLKTGNIWDAKDNHKNIKTSIDVILSTLFRMAEDEVVKIHTFSYKPQEKGITQ